MSSKPTQASRWEAEQATKRERRRLGILTCLNTQASRRGHVRANLFHGQTLNRMNLDGLIEIYSREEIGDFLVYVKITPAGTAYLSEATNHVNR